MIDSLPDDFKAISVSGQSRTLSEIFQFLNFTEEEGLEIFRLIKFVKIRGTVNISGFCFKSFII